MIKLRLFLLSLILTTSALLVLFYINKREHPSRHRPPEIVRIDEGVFYAPQLNPQDMLNLDSWSIKTVVDFRPDGEAADQTPSTQMERAAKQAGLNFHYAPVPHESIPEEAVNLINDVLSREPKPIVLYCRTGRRAVRTYALAQASRADGPNAAAIAKMVQDAGFNADDLKANIAERIAHRNSVPQTASNP